LNNSQLIDIYNFFKNKAINAGFTFEEFWQNVLRFIKNEFDCDAANWAIAGELAYNSLIEDQMI
jgi:hypothetical protein